MENSDWYENTDWFEDNDWLLGGTLVMDLTFKCVYIMGSRDSIMMKNKHGEIEIPFSLLNVEPEGMPKEMLGHLIAKRVKLRFYFMACYMKT